MRPRSARRCRAELRRPWAGVARLTPLVLAGLLTPPAASAQSLVLGGSGTGASFYSGYRFNTHYANGYYWSAFKDGTCAAGRLRVYSSPDGSVWSQAAGSPVFATFCPNEGEWAVRFLGSVIVAFAYNAGNSSRYYSKGTLNTDGSITWQKQEDPAGLPVVASDVKLNAAIVNGKPVLWGADVASAGRVSIGSSLDAPTWATVVNPTALTAGLNNNGSNGQFSAGAVFPLWGADPNDFIIIRATSLTTKSPNDRAHRVVTIKFHAATSSFDTIWYNVTTFGNANPPNLAENATTEMSLGTDDVVQTRFAAAQMSDGMIHVVYVNQNGNIVHYRRGTGAFDEVTQDAADKPLWTQHFDDTSNLDGAGAAVDKVGLTVIDGNNLYLFYSRVGAPATLYYRRFDGRAWGAETTIRPNVTLNSSFGTMETATGCDAGVAWNETASPFSVYFRLVNPACAPPTTYTRSIGTAADYNVGRVSVSAGSRVVDGLDNPPGTFPAWITANRGLGDLIVIPCGNPPTCTGGTAYTIADVSSETRLSLTTPFSGGAGTYTYLIQRQFQSAAGNAAQALIDWEDCIDGGPCTNATHLFNPGPAASGNLVSANRREVGVLYKDSIIQPVPTSSSGFQIRGSRTSATHNIVLTVAPRNRPVGGQPATAGCTTTCENVVYDGGSLGNNVLRVYDKNVTVEWIEFRNFRSFTAGSSTGEGIVQVVGNSDTTLSATFPTGTEVAQNVLFSNLLIHDFTDVAWGSRSPTNWFWSGVRGHSSCCKSLTVRNTMIWDGDRYGIEADEAGETYLVENTSIDDMHASGVSTRGVYGPDSILTVRNTISTTNTNDFYLGGTSAWSTNSANNISSNGTPPGSSPLTSTAANLYVDPPSTALPARPGDLHLKAGANVAVDSGLDLSSRFLIDIDAQYRPAVAWDRGADERDPTTAVTLVSFTAAALDSAVELEWRTGSELQNLGFNLYRSSSESGPYERITASLVPGLGSSAVGASYSYVDAELTDGATYYYELEDVETTGRTERHGPVSATPQAGAGTGTAAGGDGANGGSSPSDSDGSTVGSPGRIRYGDPAAVSLRVLQRNARGLELELLTGGFFATPEADGSVRLEVPGFELVGPAGLPAIPVRRSFLEALAGRGVRIAAVVPRDVVGFSSLRPALAEAPEMVVSRDGTVRAGSRKVRGLGPGRGLYPAAAARVVSTAFQGEVKKALVELCPLRWDPASGRLLLARRLRVRLVFAGRETGEIALGGSRGRAPRLLRRRPGGPGARLVARLATRERGLYAVGFESLFGRGHPVPVSRLRLSRLGEDVAFHLEPDPSRFGPGSVLYFLSEGASLSAYANEAVYELWQGAAGAQMAVASASPSGLALGYAFAHRQWETNRVYLSGLLEAPDLWLWDSLLSGMLKSYPFTLSGLAPQPVPATLGVWLQGGSDFGVSPDHHVRAYLNGLLVGETSWNGKRPQVLQAEVSAGILHEGQNLLELENVGDTPAAYSMVYLDHFGLDYAHTLAAEAGRFEARFGMAGTATLAGLGAGSVVLDTPEPSPAGGASPLWISGASVSPSGLSLAAEAGHRYLVVSPAALLLPEIRSASPSDLRSTQNQADYILIAPRELLPAAAPLLALRQSEGLQTRAVALEEIFDAFGSGERSAPAIQDFLAYAYQHWLAPSPRYVLLLGDATSDPKDYRASGVKDLVPAFMIKSSYLWTVSDPAYASVNGNDDLPDLALGRLPASTLEQAQSLVKKIVAYEAGGFDLSGPAVLVADNPDRAGDFEKNADEIASGPLASRPTEKIYLGRLGTTATRAATLDAFDRGASLMSYVGHGGTAVWASENLLNSWDMDKLAPQAQQPLLFTMNCLNGYFLPPTFDSLAEALVKAEDKGAIAAFSPSGLSVDEAAHVYHKALLDEIVSGRHLRLGDAILAAQSDYATTGTLPELLRIYHLFGDPALRIR